MPAWLWLLVGLALCLGELLTPGGFYLIFFGLAAVVVGLLESLGVDLPVWAEALVFSAVSVLSLLFFRRPLLQMLATRLAGKTVDRLEDEVAVVLAPIAPGAVGKVELRGASWSARNDGASALDVGQRCRIDRVEGLTLHVVAESPGG